MAAYYLLPHAVITRSGNNNADRSWLSCKLQRDAELHYGNPADFTLKVEEFEVNPGEVVAIVGRVGSGGWHMAP